MGRSSIHNLVIPAQELLALLEMTTDNEIKVLHLANAQAGGNSTLKIGARGIAVNSDEEFNYRMRPEQRRGLQNLLMVVGQQPVCIRFDLNNAYLSVSEILI